MNEYYTWTKDDPNAQAMLDAINNNPMLPIVEDNGYRMDRWAENLTEFVGDIVGFPRIPANLLAHFGIDDATRQDMLDAFTPNIVNYETLEPLPTEEEI